MIRFRLHLFAAALSVCALSACAGAASPIALSPAHFASSARSTEPLTEDAFASAVHHAGGDRRLYASNWNNTYTFPPASPAPIANSVSVFSIVNHDAPLTSIPVGPLLSPTYIAFDDFSKLYVANASTQTITVFDTRRGNVELPSITAGLAFPGGIAFDRHGKLYVSNGAQVNVYDTLHGNAQLPPIALNATIAGPIALDPSGRLYVSGMGEVIVVDTAHGNAALPSIVFCQPGTLCSFVEGMTIDRNGKLYISGSEDSILVFDTRRSNAPLPPIAANGLSGAGMVADESGRLYVANFHFGSGNSILVFDTMRANKLVETITGNGLEGVFSLAIHAVDLAVTPEQ